MGLCIFSHFRVRNFPFSFHKVNVFNSILFFLCFPLQRALKCSCIVPILKEKENCFYIFLYFCPVSLFSHSHCQVKNSSLSFLSLISSKIVFPGLCCFNCLLTDWSVYSSILHYCISYTASTVIFFNM